MTLSAIGAVSAGLVAAASSLAPHQGERSILLAGGDVYDGTSGPAQAADVLIEGREIAFIGDAMEAGVTADRTISVGGMVVAPGFIDPHTHALADLTGEDVQKRRSDNFLFQGVTTLFVGNDGGGRNDVAALAKQLAEAGIGPNVGFLAGFGHVRRTVVGKADRQPSPAELERMKTMVGEAVCDGAIGFSTGLHYAPQNFADTDEVAALAAVAAERGGIYDSHIRDESSYKEGLLASIDEALAIGARSGAPVHIAHIKALGSDTWGLSKKVIERINAARAAGQSVTADQYPWDASGTSVSNALAPRWALDGGMEALMARLDDPAVRPGLIEEMRDNLRRRGGPGALLLTRPKGGAPDAYSGKTLAALADARNEDAVQTAIHILRLGDFRVASFVMNEADIRRFAVEPWVMTGSDGSLGHPRKYGTFPKAYQMFVRKRRDMTLEQFIRRSSGLAADTFGLARRGYLKEGYVADIVVFNSEAFEPRADYDAPTELSVGVEYLVVNGVTVIERGEVTDALPGEPLLRDRSHISACAE